MFDIKPTRKQQAEITKRLVFECALRLLEERDFEKIKVRDIVEAAQVSIGTFYNYFATKIDVYYETYIMADLYFEETVVPLLTQATLSSRILCFFDHYARYSSEITSFKLTKLLYNSNNKYFDRRTDIGMLPILIRLLREGIEQKEIHSQNSPDDIAEFLMIAVRGPVYNWCTHDGSYDLRDAVSRYVTMLLRCFM